MLRQTLSGWKQFISIIAMGGIAMTLFVGLLSNAESLSERVSSFYEQGDLPSLWVITKEHETGLGSSLKNAGVLDEDDRVDSRFQINARLNSHIVYGAITAGMPALSHPIELEGEQSEAENFFFVDKSLAEDAAKNGEAIEIGKECTITYAFSSYVENFASLVDSAYSSNPEYFVSEAKKDEFKEGEIATKAKVTGIMTFPENVQSSKYYSSTYLMGKSLFVSSLHNALLEYFTEDGRTAIENYLGMELDGTPTPDTFPQDNEYLIALADSSTLNKKKEAIETYFDDHATFGKDNLSSLLDRSLNPWSATVETEVLEATQLTFVFPIVFFLVAVLVILTTLSQIILKERTQIGTMKALGLSKGQIYFHYLSLTFALVLIGSVIGFIAGPLIIPSIMAMKYNILYTLPARSLFVFPWWQALTAFAVFAVVSLLAAVLAIHKEISLTPVQSMRQEVVSFKTKASVKDKKRTPLSLSARMAFRNIRINKLKSAMVVVGVFGCTALLLCGFGIENTLDHGIDNDLNLFYSSSLSITYASARKSENNLKSYFSNGEISDVDEYHSSSINATFAGKSMTTTLRLFHDEHPYFKTDLADKGTVTISKKLTEEIGVKQGDTISFEFQNNQIEAVVGKVIEAFAVNGIYGYLSDPLFNVSTPTYTGAWVQVKDGVTPDSVKATLLKECNYVSSVRTQKDTTDQINSVMNGIRIMTNAVKVFAILLALVVLYNLALLNFRERSRDIATLKVLGFSKVEIAMSLILETISLTALGIFLGFFAGYPFMYAVLFVNRVPLVKFMYTVFPVSYLYAFLITFVTSLLINIYLSAMTGKVKMVESLKSVE